MAHASGREDAGKLRAIRQHPEFAESRQRVAVIAAAERHRRWTAAAGFWQAMAMSEKTLIHLPLPLPMLTHGAELLRQLASSGGFSPQRSDELDRDDVTRAVPRLSGTVPSNLPTSRSLDQARTGNTAILVQRLHASGQLQQSSEPDAPFGWYHGWRIIGALTRIDGGIYLGRRPREAIVVDMRRPGSALRQLYQQWLESLQRGLGDDAVRADLRTHLAARVAELVAAYMPYDEQVVRRLDARGLLQPDQPIDLDVFLRERGGVCRHQVCMVGALLERLVDEGWLQGRVSLERKHVPGWFSHAWVRFDDGDGREWILDPAQQRYGHLSGFEAEARVLYADDPQAAAVDSVAVGVESAASAP